MDKPRRKRDPKRHRTVSLLSGGTTRIDPSEYRAHTNVKRFDETRTAILRIHRHDERGIFLVYGERAEKAENGSYRCQNGDRQDVVEVYEFALNEDMIPAALRAVAEHCGIEDLLQ